MKIEFPSGTTLGDDAVKHTIVIEQLGAATIVQSEPLAGADNVLNIPRGNRSGELVFTAAKSHASYSATFTAFLAEYNRLNTQGDLVLTQNAVVHTFASAILKAVERVPAGLSSRLVVRYTFAFTTITAA